MQLLIVLLLLVYIITLYFVRNPLKHSKAFMWHRFLSWFPLGMTYAFMYMARYNLDTLATAEVITKAQKSQISGWGFFIYAASLFISGPLIDRIGGKKGMISAALGAAIFNILMGWTLYLYLHGSNLNLVVLLTAFYSLNMFFQSFGAISTIKVKSFWFHVRERGTFGAIFGTLISMGVYFALDWTEAIARAVNIKFAGENSLFRNFMQNIFALKDSQVSALWLIFFIPAGFLIAWALVDLLLIKDSPDDAGFPKLETHDASYGDNQIEVRSWISVIKGILCNKIILMIGVIEFTSGVLRDAADAGMQRDDYGSRPRCWAVFRQAGQDLGYGNVRRPQVDAHRHDAVPYAGERRGLHGGGQAVGGGRPGAWLLVLGRPGPGEQLRERGRLPG